MTDDPKLQPTADFRPEGAEVQQDARRAGLAGEANAVGADPFPTFSRTR